MTTQVVDNFALLVEKHELAARFETAGIPLPPPTTFNRLDDGLRGRDRAAELAEAGGVAGNIPPRTWTEDEFEVMEACCRLVACGLGTTDVLRIFRGESSSESAYFELSERSRHMPYAGKAIERITTENRNK